MNTLNDRRTIAQIMFICKLIDGELSASNILSSLNFKIPIDFNNNRFTRNRSNMNKYLFITNNSDEPLNLMKQKYNNYMHLFELHETTKKSLKNYFKCPNS